MKSNKLTLLLVSAFVGTLAADAQTTVFATGFGAQPDDGKDDAAALRKAAEYARTHEGTTLVIEPGTYILRDEKAVYGSYRGAGIAIEIGADSVGDARLHDNIVIEGNDIESCNNGECGIYFSNAKNVVIYANNVIKGCRQDVLVNNADVKYKKR